ncbi:TRAP transporter large permease subunit [uncultured Marivita sp.]|uniref:TRAP transporter large permease n=1 Tax=uncultured Marivita sp. TaxID=888080 RepID=UPI00262E843B|nr:TRAP transporter large permease subunit [uncultured Marivita sp.]
MADLLPVFMFGALALLLFTGYPVAWVLGGVGLVFGLIGIAAGEFMFIQFSTLPSRIYGGIMESLILTAVPTFVFMGMMLEKSGVARDLLNCLTVLLRRVPGGLALSVTVMGTVLAATTGIIGASVVMMTLLALPVMMERNYSPELATGTIASSGCLGILIPPSIMLVIMADLLSRSVGTLFMAAVMPGLLLAGLYAVYIIVRCTLNPSLAPPLPDHIGPRGALPVAKMVLRSFIPPVILIVLVLGSIIFGFATPTEAAGVGALGATLLAFLNLVVLPGFGAHGVEIATEAGPAATAAPASTGQRLRAFRKTFGEVMDKTVMTNAMIFGIFVGATLFSYIFRALGGDELIIGFVDALGLGSWGLLILILGLVFVLGFFFDWIEITLIVLPVFAPIIGQMDFGDHLPARDITYWLAILIAMNLQTSFLTPPFGFALFFLKAVAPPGVKLQQIYRGIIPFVALQLIALALVVAFPQIALWLPRGILD